MSGPKRPARTKRLYVRFTPEELTTATARADAAGRSVAVYIREAALRMAPKSRPHHHVEALIHQLARTTTALQALARTVAPVHETVVPMSNPSPETVLREALTVLQRAGRLMERRL